MKKIKSTEKKTLILRKQKLRELKAEDLQTAQGGCMMEDAHPTQ